MKGVLSFSPYLIILVCLEMKVQHVFDIVHLMLKIWSLSNSDSRSVSYHAQQNIWSNLTLGNIMEFREYLDLALKRVLNIAESYEIVVWIYHCITKEWRSFTYSLQNLQTCYFSCFCFFFFWYAIWLACTCSDVNEVQEIPSHCDKALLSCASCPKAFLFNELVTESH